MEYECAVTDAKLEIHYLVITSKAQRSLVTGIEMASPASAEAGLLRCSQGTGGSGGIAKGFALDDGCTAYGDPIVKAEGLGDATQDRGLGFFRTPAAARRGDS